MGYTWHGVCLCTHVCVCVHTHTHGVHLYFAASSSTPLHHNFLRQAIGLDLCCCLCWNSWLVNSWEMLVSKSKSWSYWHFTSFFISVLKSKLRYSCFHLNYFTLRTDYHTSPLQRFSEIAVLCFASLFFIVLHI